MSSPYRDVTAQVLAELFCAAVESGRDTFRYKEEIEERSWTEKEVWNKIIEAAAKKDLREL